MLKIRKELLHHSRVRQIETKSFRVRERERTNDWGVNVWAGKRALLSVWHVLGKQKMEITETESKRKREKKPLVFIKKENSVQEKNFTRRMKWIWNLFEPCAKNFTASPFAVCRVTCNKCQNVFLIPRICWHYMFIWSNSITSFTKFLFRISITFSIRSITSRTFANPFFSLHLHAASKNRMSNKSDSYCKITPKKKETLSHTHTCAKTPKWEPKRREWISMIERTNKKNKWQKFFK